MKQTVFYQSSMPRAGSTLLQNIVGQNPQFHVTPTSGMIDMMLGTRIGDNGNKESKAGDVKMWKEGFYAYCREGFKGYTATLTDKPYILDKNRAWGAYYTIVDEILEEYEDIFQKSSALWAISEDPLENPIWPYETERERQDRRRCGQGSSEGKGGREVNGSQGESRPHQTERSNLRLARQAQQWQGLHQGPQPY